MSKEALNHCEDKLNMVKQEQRSDSEQLSAQHVGEPVAWMHLKAYGYAPGGYMMTCRGCNNQVIDVDKRASRCRTCAEVAYANDTRPQPKRKWVGLTIEEREQIQQECFGKVPHHVAFAHAIEAKLKEKNT